MKWYKGKTKQHEYQVYNGQKFVKRKYKSLNILSQACGDLSDFYFNEKLDITIDKKSVQDKINACFEQNNFLSNSNKLMQLVKALGTGAYVPYLEKDVLKINFINASNIVILSSDNNGVQDVLFWSEKKIKDGIEFYINVHILEEDGYVIHNKKYKKSTKENEYTKVEIEKEIEKIETKSFLPKFAIITTAEVNNLDINSPYGISSYANALDTVLALDKAYDSFDNEIAIGKKRVYVPSSGLKVNISQTGETTPAFDENDIAFYTYPGKESDKLEESSFELRIEQITAAIQGQLNLLTSKMGLGHNYYKFKDGQSYVNTDNILSTNSDVYRKIKKQDA